MKNSLCQINSDNWFHWTPLSFCCWHTLTAWLIEADCGEVSIALMCGFSSASHFSHSFKSERGMTPSALRRTLLR
ncbi:helix-turn-helix domain-containing protein [Brenneria goodwinii]|uniref:helix-turn-helix domain-containing protein n=1 Tax=Brenneria goodwinii TaxID=1109412 RepID=UPI00214FF933|nr:helix-turn-helix domain-containing protein [Brenneria goodwinii]